MLPAVLPRTARGCPRSRPKGTEHHALLPSTHPDLPHRSRRRRGARGRLWRRHTPPTRSATAAENVGKQFVAFAVCMRSHGVPGYPDPEVSSSGNRVQVTISPGSADPNSPAFKSAGHTCHNLLPNGGNPVNGPQRPSAGPAVRGLHAHARSPELPRRRPRRSLHPPVRGRPAGAAVSARDESMRERRA